MKKYLMLFSALVVSFALNAMFFTSDAHALISNPDPSSYADDDGTELFTPETYLLNLEIYDLGGSLGAGSTFGFFFESSDVTNPANRVTIFAPDDQAGLLQQAVVDFSSGHVYDADDPNFAIDPSLAVQDTFTGTGNIGFFLELDPSFAPLTFFTVAALNPGGVDSAATFRSLSNPSAYLMAFEDSSTGTLLGVDLVLGVSPAVVPEPSSLLLLGTGIISAAYLRRRLAKR